MLISLEIINYALIEQLKVNFQPGLNVITGETGAGKSIILGALGLVMGKRADTKVLFDQDKKCIVEAIYDITKLKLSSFFESNDLDYEEMLSIRREINSKGKSRAFINDTPTTLEVLQNLNEHILDLHQQFDTQLIQQPSQQLAMLDLLAKNHETIDKYSASYTAYKHALKELDTLRAQDKASSKEIDFIIFQLKELEDGGLVDLDIDKLESQVSIINKSEDIKRVYSLANMMIEDNDNSILSQLNELAAELRVTDDIGEEFSLLNDRLNSSIEELKDIANESHRISESTNFDEEEASLIQEKISAVYRLQQKHHVNNLEELLAIQEALSEKSRAFKNIDKEILKKEKEVDTLKINTVDLGKKISKSRKSVTKSFESEVGKVLSGLAMANARLLIDIQDQEEPMSNGLDKVTFLFSANKGGMPNPLKDVASGGETSRLALSIKSILAKTNDLPTMVFDEIDSGVSGEIANMMGKILLNLSKSHQVITITHSPQIASKARQHFYVYKFDSEERTHTNIKTLNSEERTTEIATMMSGHPPTKTALLAAKELLDITT